MSNLISQVAEAICRRRLLRKGQGIVVAVSGGLDSMVLLDVLGRLGKVNEWRLTVAHLNHRLRGKSSDADERLVRRTAKKLGLPIAVERAGVRDFAREHGLSIEMAARELRHEFLARTAARLKVNKVAVAHHADDQVELFFLRLLRGSGGEGLAGMKWSNPSPASARIEIVRPLLGLSKAVLKEYAAENRIVFREDRTNASLDILRNRIRHELMPLLRKEYQPALDKAVLRVMEIVGAEAEVVKGAAGQWMRKNSNIQAPSSRESSNFKHQKRTSNIEGNSGERLFNELPVAVQRAVLRVQLMERGVAANFDLVEELRLTPERAVSVGGQRRAKVDARKRPPLPGPLLVRAGPAIRRRGGKTGRFGRLTKDTFPIPIYVLRDIYGRIRIERPTAVAVSAAGKEILLQGRGGELEFYGLRGRWRVDAKNSDKLPERRAAREVFDAEKVGSRILLRHWRAGDRFQPIGMNSAIKLQDLFTNAKVPRARRHELTIAVAENGEIFWVEGMRISEGYKIRKETRRKLVWMWRRRRN